jgi:alkyldihydroxyacetonephosphate synthase
MTIANSARDGITPTAMLWRHKWGFRDTAFVIQSDRSIVMTGDRYPLSGCKLDKLLPHIEESFGVQLDIDRQKQEVTEIAIAPPHQNSGFYDELAQLFPADRYSFDDEERLVHSHGQTTTEEVYKVLYSQLERLVDLVFYCESEQDARILISLATKHHVCLVPFGGGTSVSAALQLPKSEPRTIGAVNMQRMNQIEWIDRENLRACVQAGITGTQLENQLNAAGFTCGHEPDSLEFSTLGGWIATNASGMKKNRYGNIEQIIENITTIAPCGTLEQIQPLARAAIGIQPQHLLFGSEGNLGLITKAVIKIHALPEVKEYYSVLFPNFDRGLQFLKQLAHSGAVPASVRLVDNAQFRFAQALKPQAVGFSAIVDRLSKFYLLKIRHFDPHTMVAATIVFEGSATEVAFQKATIHQLAKQHQGLIAGSKNGQRGYLLTFAIAYIRDFLSTFHIIGETFETTVPWSQVQQVCQAVSAQLNREHQHYNFPGQPYLSYRVTQLYQTSVCIYFTLGIYTHGVIDADRQVSAIEHALRQTIIDNGGSISHHHGVGKIRSKYMNATISPASIELLRQVKHSIDPNNIFGISNNIFNDRSQF